METRGHRLGEMLALTFNELILNCLAHICGEGLRGSLQSMTCLKLHT